MQPDARAGRRGDDRARKVAAGDAERGQPLERRADPDAHDHQRGRHEGAAGRRVAERRRRTSAAGSRPTRAIRVEGYEDVWAGGDNAAVPLPTRSAWTRASVPAGRALRDEAGLPDRQEHRPGDPGPASRRRSASRASARARRWARRSAVAELQGHRDHRACPPGSIWRLLLAYYFPSWDRRLRLLTDWLIWPLVGRDIVELRTAPPGEYEVRHNVFQPGEVVAQEERTGKYIHVIVEGEVEILNKEGDLEQVLDDARAGRPLRHALDELVRPRDRHARRRMVRTVAHAPRPGAAAPGGAAARPVSSSRSQGTSPRSWTPAASKR